MEENDGGSACCDLQVLLRPSECLPGSLQPFQDKLASTTDPDKKQMLERLDAAVATGLQPLQAAVDRGAADGELRPLAQVRMSDRCASAPQVSYDR